MVEVSPAQHAYRRCSRVWIFDHLRLWQRTGLLAKMSTVCFHSHVQVCPRSEISFSWTRQLVRSPYLRSCVSTFEIEVHDNLLSFIFMTPVVVNSWMETFFSSSCRGLALRPDPFRKSDRQQFGREGLRWRGRRRRLAGGRRGSRQRGVQSSECHPCGHAGRSPALCSL